MIFSENLHPLCATRPFRSGSCSGLFADAGVTLIA
jgi:hypothetical protein